MRVNGDILNARRRLNSPRRCQSESYRYVCVLPGNSVARARNALRLRARSRRRTRRYRKRGENFNNRRIARLHRVQTQIRARHLRLHNRRPPRAPKLNAHFAAAQQTQNAALVFKRNIRAARKRKNKTVDNVLFNAGGKTARARGDRYGHGRFNVNGILDKRLRLAAVFNHAKVRAGLRNVRAKIRLLHDNRRARRNNIQHQWTARKSRARDSLAVFPAHRIKEMRARVKTSGARRRGSRLVKSLFKGKTPAEVAAVMVVIQTRLHAAARLNINAETRALVVGVAKLSLPAVITGAQTHPLNKRHAQNQIGVVTLARVYDNIAAPLRSGQREITVCRQFAKARFNFRAERRAPQLRIAGIFVVGESVQAAQKIIAHRAAEEKPGVKTLEVGIQAAISAQLPADDRFVVFNKRARGVNVKSRRAPAQRGFEIHARAAHKTETIHRRIAQRARQRLLGVNNKRKRRRAKFADKLRAPYLAPLAHVNVLAVAVANEQVVQLRLLRQHAQQRAAHAPFGFLAHFRNNVVPKTRPAVHRLRRGKLPGIFGVAAGRKQLPVLQPVAV